MIELALWRDNCSSNLDFIYDTKSYCCRHFDSYKVFKFDSLEHAKGAWVMLRRKTKIFIQNETEGSTGLQILENHFSKGSTSKIQRRQRMRIIEEAKDEK